MMVFLFSGIANRLKKKPRDLKISFKNIKHKALFKITTIMCYE